MIDAIRSEWIKVRTIRVTWVLVIVAVAFPVVVTTLTAIFADDLSGRDLAEVITGTTVVAAMLIGVVAAVGITGEFGHGTIRPTFAAMPDRLRPLLAKPIVHVVVAAAVSATIVVVTWLLGTLLAQGGQSLTDDGVRPALLGVVLLAVGLTVLGYGLGLLVRNAALAICILLLWPLIGENLIAGLLGVAGAEGMARYLPYIAGINMAAVEPDADALARWWGGLYFLAWVAAVAGLGVVSGARRDA